MQKEPALGVQVTRSTGLSLFILTVKILKQVQYPHLDELGGRGPLDRFNVKLQDALTEGRAQTLYPWCCLYA